MNDCFHILYARLSQDTEIILIPDLKAMAAISSRKSTDLSVKQLAESLYTSDSEQNLLDSHCDSGSSVDDYALTC
jgi:hypothetical protein